MSSLGKSINLYLMDGTASGRWQATLSNWNACAYKIPRGVLKNCDDLPELRAPGVYFLFGRDDETQKQFIYIGEADDTLKRILQPHTFEKDGSYWTEAVIYVTPDGTLEKGRVKYLENRFYSIACDAKRYIVKNANTPPQSPMTKRIRDMLEEFILNVQLILPALGYMAFEPLPSSDKDDVDVADELLYFSRNKGKGGNAIGRITSDGFWVLKGSYIYPQVANYVPHGIKKLRKDYAGSIDKNGILQEDICFGSPSYASTFVCGKNSNGLTEWKNKEGVTLKGLNFDDSEELDISKKQTNEEVKEVISIDADSEILHLAGKKAIATGKICGKGFIVLKGSQMSSTETRSCYPWIRDLRASLIAEGKVKDYIFMEDAYFNSPSGAAACVVGASANGKEMWIYPDGKSINDHNSEL